MSLECLKEGNLYYAYRLNENNISEVKETLMKYSTVHRAYNRKNKLLIILDNDIETDFSIGDILIFNQTDYYDYVRYIHTKDPTCRRDTRFFLRDYGYKLINNEPSLKKDELLFSRLDWLIQESFRTCTYCCHNNIVADECICDDCSDGWKYTNFTLKKEYYPFIEQICETVLTSVYHVKDDAYNRFHDSYLTLEE